jgi:hypothetical protein
LNTKAGTMMPHGRNAALLAGGYGLKPETLAALLEKWRQAALAARR